MSDEVNIAIQYYNEIKQISVLKSDKIDIENFKNKIKDEFSSFVIDYNNVTINYFKRNENKYTIINDNDELKNFIEKAPKKHLTLINKEFEEKFLNDNKEHVKEIDDIEDSINPELKDVKSKMEESGNELIANLENYSDILPELVFKDIDNNICEVLKDIFKCDINEDQTESFEENQDKKKCDLCEAYIKNEYYFKSNTKKIICKYCESRYRKSNYYDDNGVYFLVRQNNEDKLYDVKCEKPNKMLDKMEYSEEIKNKAYEKKLDNMLVNEIKENIIINYNYNELIEEMEKKKDIHIEAKIPYENIGTETLQYLKFGCVGNKENYTNWKGLEGIIFPCEFNNKQLLPDEKQEVIFKKRYKKEDLIPGVLFYPLYLKNDKNKSVEGSLRILEIHNILYGDEYELKLS